MPPFPVIGAITAFAAVAPDLAEAGLKVFERIKSLRKPQTQRPQGETEEGDVHDINAALTNIREQLDDMKEHFNAADERFDDLEAVVESQAELIVHLTSHNATLARWVLILGIGLGLSIAVAIASLVLALI